MNAYQCLKKNRNKQTEVPTCQGSKYKPVKKLTQWWVENMSHSLRLFITCKIFDKLQIEIIVD